MEALPNESTKVAFTVTNTGLVAGTSTEPVAGTCTQQKMGVRIGNEQQTTGVKVGAEPAGMEPVYETIMLELDRIKQVKTAEERAVLKRDVETYLQQVEQTYDKEIYFAFLGCLFDFFKDRANAVSTISEITKLFPGNHSLMIGLNLFFPGKIHVDDIKYHLKGLIRHKIGYYEGKGKPQNLHLMSFPTTTLVGTQSDQVGHQTLHQGTGSQPPHDAGKGQPQNLHILRNPTNTVVRSQSDHVGLQTVQQVIESQPPLQAGNQTVNQVAGSQAGLAGHQTVNQVSRGNPSHQAVHQAVNQITGNQPPHQAGHRTVNQVTGSQSGQAGHQTVNQVTGSQAGQAGHQTVNQVTGSQSYQVGHQTVNQVTGSQSGQAGHQTVNQVTGSQAGQAGHQTVNQVTGSQAGQAVHQAVNQITGNQPPHQAGHRTVNQVTGSQSGQAGHQTVNQVTGSQAGQAGHQTVNQVTGSQSYQVGHQTVNQVTGSQSGQAGHQTVNQVTGSQAGQAGHQTVNQVTGSQAGQAGHQTVNQVTGSQAGQAGHQTVNQVTGSQSGQAGHQTVNQVTGSQAGQAGHQTVNQVTGSQAGQAGHQTVNQVAGSQSHQVGHQTVNQATGGQPSHQTRRQLLQRQGNQPCHSRNQPIQLRVPQNEKDLKSALDFLSCVKYELGMVKYRGFVDLLQLVKEKKLTVARFTHQFESLFKGNPEFLQGINLFLPSLSTKEGEKPTIFSRDKLMRDAEQLSLNFHDYTSVSTVRLIRLSQGKSPDQAKNSDKTTHETSGESCSTTNNNQDIDQSLDASSDTGPASEEDTHRDLTKTVDVKTEPPDNLDNLIEFVVPENLCSNLHNDGVNDTDTDSEEDTHRNVPKTVDVEARPPNNLDSLVDNLVPQTLYRNLHNVGVNDTDNLAVNGEAEMARDILNEHSINSGGLKFAEMYFDDKHACALMEVYEDICFKMQFEDKISLTADLVLHVDDVKEYRYSLSRVLYHRDKDAWRSGRHDVSVQTDSPDVHQTNLNNENGAVSAIIIKEERDTEEYVDNSIGKISPSSPGQVPENTEQSELKDMNCPLCPDQFQDEEGMAKHLRDSHDIGNMYVCTVCQAICWSNKSFTQHMKRHQSQSENKKSLQTPEKIQKGEIRSVLQDNINSLLKESEANLVNIITAAGNETENQKKLESSKSEEVNTASEKVTNSKSNRKRLKTDVKREKDDRIDEEQDSDMKLIEYFDDNVADPDFNVEECEEDSDVTIIEDDDDNNVVEDYDDNIADSDFDAEEYAKTIKIEKTHFKMDKKPYTTTCPTCRKECGTRKAFRHHVETVHTQAICDYCGNSYKGYTTLKRHIRAIHKEVKHYKCTIEGCEARFNFHHSLKLHILKHTGERPDVCSVCGKSYLTSDHLKAHFQAIHTNIKNFICRFCGESFSYPGSHNIHERRHIGRKDRRFPCEQCEKTFATRHVLECHVMTKHTTGGHHTCDICHKVYKTEYTLKMHQHYHTQDKQRFMCDTCGKGFMYKSVLKLHKSVHVNDKNFKCMTCGKCFKTYPTLSTHNRLVHNDDHPFECSICKKAFKTKVSCKTHERTHSGLKQFKCAQCHHCFSNNGGLQKHLKTVHVAEKKFVCHICGKATSRADNLRVHMKVHGNIKSR